MSHVLLEERAVVCNVLHGLVYVAVRFIVTFDVFFFYLYNVLACCANGSCSCLCISAFSYHTKSLLHASGGNTSGNHGNSHALVNESSIMGVVIINMSGLNMCHILHQIHTPAFLEAVALHSITALHQHAPHRPNPQNIPVNKTYQSTKIIHPPQAHAQHATPTA